MRKTKKILATLILFLAFQAPVLAASGGKGLLIKDVQLFKTANQDPDAWSSYSVSACSKTKTKLTNKLKISAKLYIPTTFLSKGNTLWFSLGASLHAVKQDMRYVGDIESADSFLLINDGGKIQVAREHAYIRSMERYFMKIVSANGMCKAKKKNGYYEITFQNVPLDDQYWPVENDQRASAPVSLNLKNQYCLNAHINLNIGDGRALINKNVKGNVYVDDVSIKAAKTTMVTFDKKDSLWYDAGFGGGEEWKNLEVKIAALP